MKTILTSLPLITVLLLASCQSANKSVNDPAGLKGKISISGAFALYPMAERWGEEFTKIHPGVSFDIQAGGTGKGVTDVLNGMVDLAMLGRDITDAEIKKGGFPIAVAKDAVLPTFDVDNPYYGQIEKTGITRQQLTDIWLTGKIKTWGDLLHNNSTEKIEVYTRSDVGGATETWAKFLGGKQEDIIGIGIFGDPGLAEAVSKNKYAIGFNNLGYIYDEGTRKPNEGLRVLPIDLNGDGLLAPDENFYNTSDHLDEAIAKGVYPSPPARALYFASKGNPTDTLVKAFLQWVLTDGQKFVRESDYVKLPDEVLQSELKKLTK